MFFYILSEWLFSLLDFFTIQTWKWICGLDDLIYLKIFYQFWYTNLSREFSHIHSSSNFYPSRTFTKNNLKIFNTTFSHFYYQISSMKLRSILFLPRVFSLVVRFPRGNIVKKKTIAEKLISKPKASSWKFCSSSLRSIRRLWLILPGFPTYRRLVYRSQRK